MQSITEEMGMGMLVGYDPLWQRNDVPWMPKGRYRIMRNHMPKVGTLGLDMMKRTCTIQVNLDYSSEQDMARKFRTSLALQPVATAIFANSLLSETVRQAVCFQPAQKLGQIQMLPVAAFLNVFLKMVLGMSSGLIIFLMCRCISFIAAMIIKM